MHCGFIFALFLAVLLKFSAPSLAAEPVPGDACSGAGKYVVSGGPELSGIGHLMVCDSSVWKTVLDYNASGQVTKLGNQTCTTNQILKFDGTKWACAADSSTGASSTWGMNKVATSQTTTSATYADLATTGPAVTVATDTQALVTLTARASNSTASKYCKMGVDVSGATTMAASDTYALILTSPGANGITQASATFLVSGLTAGSNTFTAKYAAGSNTCTFVERNIAVAATGTQTTCSDTTPDVFSFSYVGSQPWTHPPNLVNQSASTLVTSNIVPVVGFSCSVATSISGAGSPAYRVCNDSACSSVALNWTSSPGSISVGQYVQLRLTTGTADQTRSAYFVAGTVGAPWNVTAAGTCTTTKVVGTLCADGTLFAGISPDGHRMYIGRCPVGMTWGGSSCSGTETTATWNNGATGTIATGVQDYNNGVNNTNTLATLSNAESPYAAAVVCYNYTGYSNTDWYLPSPGEINVILPNYAALNMTGNQAWSSAENNQNPTAEAIMVGPGYSYYNGQKNNSGWSVNCIRRT